MKSQFNRIKRRRQSIGMSQEALALTAGITQSQVSRYERGLNDPTGDILVKIAHALNTTADYILGVTDNPDREVTEDNLDSLETEIFQLLRSSSEDDRKRALSVIKAMLVTNAS